MAHFREDKRCRSGRSRLLPLQRSQILLALPHPRTRAAPPPAPAGLTAAAEKMSRSSWVTQTLLKTENSIIANKYFPTFYVFQEGLFWTFRFLEDERRKKLS